MSCFYSTWSGILDSVDSVALIKRKSFKPKPDPWLNDTTCGFRQRCRQAKLRWKRDRLLVSLAILKDSLADYQKAVKEATCQYLSNVISNNNNHSRELFRTIISVLNPSALLSDVTTTTRENFLQFFTDMVASVRHNIVVTVQVG